MSGWARLILRLCGIWEGQGRVTSALFPAATAALPATWSENRLRRGAHEQSPLFCAADGECTSTFTPLRFCDCRPLCDVVRDAHGPAGKIYLSSLIMSSKIVTMTVSKLTTCARRHVTGRHCQPHPLSSAARQMEGIASARHSGGPEDSKHDVFDDDGREICSIQ